MSFIGVTLCAVSAVENWCSGKSVGSESDCSYECELAVFLLIFSDVFVNIKRFGCRCMLVSEFFEYVVPA